MLLPASASAEVNNHAGNDEQEACLLEQQQQQQKHGASLFSPCAIVHCRDQTPGKCHGLKVVIPWSPGKKNKKSSLLSHVFNDLEIYFQLNASKEHCVF